MERDKPEKTDVLIVGAGPAGLMMACQLALHQVSFRILDQKEKPSQHSGALIVQARTLELFEKMGIADQALRHGTIADRVNLLFKGKKLATTAISKIGESLSQFPFLLLLEQSWTEKLLLNFLKEKGHAVERSIHFKSFSTSAEEITSVVSRHDGTTETLRSTYLIGADGHKSKVRELLQIPFEGKTLRHPIFIMDVEAESVFVDGEINFLFSNTSVAGFFPISPNRWRIDGSFPKEMKNKKDIGAEDVSKNLSKWLNMKVKTHNIEWFSVAHAHQKYAAQIKVGNCFLIGDAAHVNSPIGAQGMNAGLQDAWNLAWKIAFVLKKQAHADLLETYPVERWGITQGFARYADVVFKTMTGTQSTVKFFRMTLIKFFFTALFPLVEKRKWFRLRFFTSISQIGLHYASAPSGSPFMKKMFSHHDFRSGKRFPYMAFVLNTQPTDTHRLLDATRFTLVLFAPELTAEWVLLAEKYQFSLVLIPHQVETAQLYKTLALKHNGYFLVRPDMHIALRSSSTRMNVFIQFLKESGWQSLKM